jgi:hypothetical protein
MPNPNLPAFYLTRLLYLVSLSSYPSAAAAPKMERTGTLPTVLCLQADKLQ